jgi:lipoate-protein ligase B
LEHQKDLQEQRKAQTIVDTVLLVEHTPVITLGARASANRLLVPEQTLQEAGIDLVPVRRGGGGTAHNPGQIVFYPILNLQERHWGISNYIARLEAVGMNLLAELDVKAEQVPGERGLWVGPRKIASIGVRISRSVTHHGMAINIKNDLRIFDYLIPCGLEGVVVTSVQEETGRQYAMQDVKERLVNILNDLLAP